MTLIKQILNLRNYIHDKMKYRKSQTDTIICIDILYSIAW